jgi:CheY-like chemotaxis protein
LFALRPWPFTLPDAVQALRPDVAILDYEMPHRTGLDVARLVHALDLPTRALNR